MEKLAMNVIENRTNESINSKTISLDIREKNSIFFNLKQHSLIQKVLINTLLIRTDYFIDDLAKLLHTDAKKLHQVWKGKGTLTEKKSRELINLFYILSN